MDGSTGTSIRLLSDKAWAAIAARISPTGELTGVCESTGKQKTLDGYLHRKALSGRDARGGGMALLFATELCCHLRPVK